MQHIGKGIGTAGVWGGCGFALHVISHTEKIGGDGTGILFFFVLLFATITTVEIWRSAK